MSDCCSPGTGFPNANTMGQISMNHPVVWAEICAIQQAILEAANNCPTGQGSMQVKVGGCTPMTFIKSVIELNIQHGGSGYFVDTPAIRAVHPTGKTGDIASFDIAVVDGQIQFVTVLNGGSGYQPIKPKAIIRTRRGEGADIYPIFDWEGHLDAINIFTPGTGYEIGDPVIIERADGLTGEQCGCADAIAHVCDIDENGGVREICIKHCGKGYFDNVAKLYVVSSHNRNLMYPIGDFFVYRLNIDNLGTIKSVDVLNPGVGYYDLEPSVSFLGTGSGASASVTLTDGVVTGIQLESTGQGFGSDTVVEVYNPYTSTPPHQPDDKAIIVPDIKNNCFATDPLKYYRVWIGADDDRAYDLQLNAVTSYFRKLGYTIDIQTNPDSGNTIMWEISW